MNTYNCAESPYLYADVIPLPRAGLAWCEWTFGIPTRCVWLSYLNCRGTRQ